MTNNPELQNTLFKAAKVGHIDLMRELIKAGADPFVIDKFGHNAFFYADKENPEEAKALLKEFKGSEYCKNS